MRRMTVIAVAALGVFFGLGGLAFAVSSGGYDPAQQDCSPTADAYNKAHEAEAGCHALKINVEGGNQRIAEFGIDQVPDGHSDISYGLGGIAAPGREASPHDGCFAVNTAGTGGGPGTGCGSNPNGLGFSGTYNINPIFAPIAAFVWGPDGDASCYSRPLPSTDPNCHPVPGAPSDPVGIVTGTANATPDTGSNFDALAAALQKFSFYMGADDNMDAGEHDGVDGLPSTGTDQMPNGPSDGGAIVANWHPLEATAWLDALVAGNTTYILQNPVPVADGGMGACADSICAAATTRQREVYSGTGNNGRSRDVADYSGKEWDPQDCSSGDLSGEQACHDATHSSMNDYRTAEADHVYAEPGVQFYSDPDPQGSPIFPEPHSAVYVGTCGVILGGGYLPPMGPASPTPPAALSNDAGQLDINTCK